MRASLNADGTLLIEAENGLESFALHCWSQRYLVNSPLQEKIIVAWGLETVPLSEMFPARTPTRS